MISKEFMEVYTRLWDIEKSERQIWCLIVQITRLHQSAHSTAPEPSFCKSSSNIWGYTAREFYCCDQEDIKSRGRSGSQQLCGVVLVHREQVQTQLCHNMLHSSRPRIIWAVTNCSVAISSSENKGVPDNEGEHLAKGQTNRKPLSGLAGKR